MSETAILNDEPEIEDILLDEDDSTASLLLNLDGYEGPIDVLLVMARDQKVDLRHISILALARQYLDFIDKAQSLQLELAAEYLVMAAWLAYLKSRLLLPRDNDSEEPDAQAIADALQFQLRRLEAIKKGASDLFGLPQLGNGIFARGMPEGLRTRMITTFDASLMDILRAYGDIEHRHKNNHYELPVFHLMSLEGAMERLTTMLGKLPRKGPFSVWTTLHSFVPEGIKDKLYVRSSTASIFTAGLELAKQGKLEIKQDGLFRPIYMRAKDGEEARHDGADQEEHDHQDFEDDILDDSPLEEDAYDDEDIEDEDFEDDDFEDDDELDSDETAN